ncbi:MAG TPA: hypothetical protein VGF94_11565 [Kofleriaceae bacterium]|jgi:hypothetical protein
MKFCVVLFGLALAACHSDTPPQAPADKAPLPSSSGTPIGFLIDGAGALHLRDDQVAKLRDIDTGLSGELEGLDSKLRAANKPGDQGSASGGRGVHMRGGGMGRNGMGGRGRGAAPQGSGNDAHRAVVANGLSDQRAADVERALHSAFGVLDPDQRDGAKQLLTDHDIDYDDGDDAAPAAPPPP